MPQKAQLKGSRRERKAERERLRRAGVQGLAVRESAGPEAGGGAGRGPGPAAEPASQSPSGRVGRARSPLASVPPLVWVLGAAFLLLLGAYWLSQMRSNAAP
jgi:hypothetical protein